MSHGIEYGNLMHRAMRSLIREVLTNVAADGLPGQHHFFITFDTSHPDVAIADWLRDRYPDEMTVVMQHWFDDLDVREDSFSVTLNFGDSPEPLLIPYDAIRTFVDPSVEFGLRFETQEDDEEDDLLGDELGEIEELIPEPKESTQQSSDGEVVSLDSFRK